jgi:hypothetical protein
MLNSGITTNFSTMSLVIPFDAPNGLNWVSLETYFRYEYFNCQKSLCMWQRIMIGWECYWKLILWKLPVRLKGSGLKFRSYLNMPLIQINHEITLEECDMIPELVFLVSMTTHKMHHCYLKYLESNQGKHRLPIGRLLSSLS